MSALYKATVVRKNLSRSEKAFWQYRNSSDLVAHLFDKAKYEREDLALTIREALYLISPTAFLSELTCLSASTESASCLA